jgi:uncharacterized protein (DUF488 family)
MPQQQQLFTIGHSTRPLQELVDMLQANGVRLLVDVRTVPKSRTNPQVTDTLLTHVHAAASYNRGWP